MFKSDDEPIDMVYTWVANTEEHRKLRYSVLKGVQREHDNHDNRYSDHEELRFALRSVYQYASWIRQIFVVVQDGQRPSWLRKGSETCSIPVIVVTHSELYGTDMASHLPTFNSQSIELHLHKCPGLSERFLYANDDHFFGNFVQKKDFYTDEGMPKYLLTSGDVALRPRESMCQHDLAWLNNRKLLASLFPRKTRKFVGGRLPYPAHQLVPLTKSMFASAWEHPLTGPLLLETSASKFRAHTNVYLIGLLIYWRLETGQAQQSTDLSHVYMAASGHVCNDFVYNNLMQGATGLFRRRPELFCINDVAPSTSEQSAIADMVQSLLSRYFPTPCAAEAK